MAPVASLREQADATLAKLVRGTGRAKHHALLEAASRTSWRTPKRKHLFVCWGNSEMTRVMFVEDDHIAHENLAFELRQAGLEVLKERVPEVTLQSVNRCAPDVLLLAIGHLPGERIGMEFLCRLRHHVLWRHLPVIVLSRSGNLRNVDVVSLGIRAVVARPEATGRDVAWWIRAAIPSREAVNGEPRSDQPTAGWASVTWPSLKPHGGQRAASSRPGMAIELGTQRPAPRL